MTAIDFLGAAKSEERPAFFYVAFNAPHDPRQSPQEFLDRTHSKELQSRSRFCEYPYAEEIGAGKRLQMKGLRPSRGRSRLLRFTGENITPS